MVEHLDYGMKNNLDLLQDAEVVNAGTDLTTYASKINKDDDDRKISVKEEENTI